LTPESAIQQEEERAKLYERAAALERIQGHNKRTIDAATLSLSEMRTEYQSGQKELADIKRLLKLSKARKPKPQKAKPGPKKGSHRKSTTAVPEVPQTTPGEAQRPSANDIGYVGDMICPTEEEIQRDVPSIQTAKVAPVKWI